MREPREYDESNATGRYRLGENEAGVPVLLEEYEVRRYQTTVNGRKLMAVFTQYAELNMMNKVNGEWQ